MYAFWQLLRKLRKVGHGVQPIVLDGEAILVDFFVVVDDFLTCDPSFNEDSVVSYFAVYEVVGWVVAPADFDGVLCVLCCSDLILQHVKAVLVLLPLPVNPEDFCDGDFSEGACDVGLPPMLQVVRAV